jgi:hypothetical protein
MVLVFGWLERPGSSVDTLPLAAQRHRTISQTVRADIKMTFDEILLVCNRAHVSGDRVGGAYAGVTLMGYQGCRDEMPLQPCVRTEPLLR